MAGSTNTVATASTIRHRKKEKIIVIMGASGTEKSRLSINLATRYSPFEIINSDKMQLYKGLDITTNKIPLHEHQNIPHRFLGEFDSQDGELIPLEFRHLPRSTISDINFRKNKPLVVGRSNSFISALLGEEYNPKCDVFDKFNSVKHVEEGQLEKILEGCEMVDDCGGGNGEACSGSCKTCYEREEEEKGVVRDTMKGKKKKGKRKKGKKKKKMMNLGSSAS